MGERSRKKPAMGGGGSLVEGGNASDELHVAVEYQAVGRLCGSWSGLPLDIAEGVRAYALRQADVHRSIRDSFQEMWNRPLNPPVSKEETGEDGPEPFVDPMLESIVESHEDD